MVRSAPAMRALIAKATPEQREAAKPFAIVAAKATTPGQRAWAVVNWLKQLGEDPKRWVDSQRDQRVRELSN